MTRRVLWSVLIAIGMMLGAGDALASAVPTGAPALTHFLPEMHVPPPPAGELIAAPCPYDPTWAGCHYADGRIYVYPVTRAMAFHELGHAYLHTVMNDGDRHRFTTIMRYTPFRFGGDNEERLADAYASCAFGVGPRSYLFVNGHGYFPAAHQHREVCALITHAGSRRGLLAPRR